MKFKLKKKKHQNIIVIALFLFLLPMVTSFSGSLEHKSLSGELIHNTSVLDKAQLKERNVKIDNYISNNIGSDKVAETQDVNKEVTSVLTKEESEYKSYLFDYATGEKLDIDNLIKSDRKEEFDNKIKELLYLKYPTFIADVLVTNMGRNTYFFKENEMIIYYYDYAITPAVNKELFLKVNYNEIYEYLDFTVELDKEYTNENGFDIDPNSKLIAITFDDGPSPYTETLVDILNANKAHSTFYFQGYLLNIRSSAVLKVHNTNNEIGYHSYNHKNFKRQNLEEIKSELDKSNEILRGITGENFAMVRPPYGSINDDVATVLNMPVILWEVDTNDWRYKDVDYLVNHVLDYGKDGSIVLFHDTYETSIAAIKRLLPELYVRGYQVVTVSQLAEAKGFSLENMQIYRSIR